MSEVAVETRDARLPADLELPAGAKALVIFAHGSGSSRFSPRNRHVAARLNQAGLGTLLLDMLTPAEDEDPEARFDIELLAARLAAVIEWWPEYAGESSLPIGLFGASTGAASALVAAAREPSRVFAVVSRGGRPDLAGDSLRLVQAPVLLIVGGLDAAVIELNREAFTVLPLGSSLEIVPGATHLFEEPGKLDVVASLAGEWFNRHAPRPLI